MSTISTHAPGGMCERYKFTKYSPGVVMDEESISRIICSPIHVNPKTGKLKSAAFSYFENRGCSVQRESVAQDSEISEVVGDLLNSNDSLRWCGVATAKTQDLRSMQFSSKRGRAIAVYDSAELKNPAHAEFCLISQSNLEDGDMNELRRLVMLSFGNGLLVHPNAYRGGAVKSNLSNGLRAQCL